MHYRAMTLADCPAVSRLFQASWKNGYRGILSDGYLDALPPDHWIEFLHKGLSDGSLTGWLCEETEQLIGAAVLGPNEIPDCPDDRELRCLYVHPDAQGRGIGSTLVRWAVDTLKAQGVPGCNLCVFTANRRALVLYEKLGFTPHLCDLTVPLGEREYPYAIYRLPLP